MYVSEYIMTALIKIRIEKPLNKQGECDEILEAPEVNLCSNEQRLHEDLHTELNVCFLKEVQAVL